jgi:alpha-beta hydrolase superfamily lysophospholipase
LIAPAINLSTAPSRAVKDSTIADGGPAGLGLITRPPRIADVTSHSRQARIPKRLPIHIIAGSRDPVSAGTKTLQHLLTAYESVSLERVTHRFYPDARHELFNEINREEVTCDVLAWLDGIIG